MRRFFGNVGFAEQTQTAPGVWADVITEKAYYGDLQRQSAQRADDSMVNSKITVGNSISIVADDYANERIFAIRYVSWAGALWEVTSVEKESPRLILKLGGTYNGPTA